MSPISIAVIGQSGQVARALTREAAARGVRLLAAGRPSVDLTDAGSVYTFLLSTKADLIVNAGAITGVDKAEVQRDQAFLINAAGPRVLSRLAAETGVPVIHLSTDYVFDGANRTPYVESDPIAPMGVYGASKAAGEAAVRDEQPQHLILRTSWVFSSDGENFVKTMLRLGAARDEVGVVSDQVGCPTYAGDIAGAILELAPRLVSDKTGALWGTYHYTNCGATTWHDFAVEIFALAGREGLRVPRLKAITTAEYPTPARRPTYSVLDNTKFERAFGLARRHWREPLQACIKTLAQKMREGGLS